ncbi:hypothetical protein COV20_01260 [Candidatus Woesearchaeota archaeon CG10_big_fil_rev_8_21_14_0_10_45_16]|nr:MAG: hypothetical protein COV20_01260 [Candidatus Woesearchaeota archaeon CG10_big_fil_rev_8_21_14_0_10_45_16]
MKVLDTSFLIDLMHGDPKTKPIAELNEILLTTQINMYEIMVGLFYKNMKPSKLLQIQEMFENIRVLPLDENGIMRSAEISANLIKRGEIIEDCDCLTAGIALSRGISTIVTANKKHFQRIKGITVESY